MAESKVDVFKILSEEGTALLKRHGEDRLASDRGGYEFARRVIKVLGKQQIYFPKYTIESAKIKNSALKEEFAKSNESVTNFAKRHGISRVLVYNILKTTQGVSKSTKLQGDSAVQCIAMEAARMLIKHGVPPIDAAEASRGVSAILCARWGGKIIYFPTEERYALTEERHQQWWVLSQEGVFTADIAARYDVTPGAVSHVLRKFRAENGDETPRASNRRKALRVLQERILDVAKPYIGKNNEVSALLESAAEYVAKAREAAKVVPEK